MSEKVVVASGGIGFWGILAIIFITLKAVNLITWSWFWVLAPLWIPVVLFIAVTALILLVAAIVAILGLIAKKFL